MATFLDIGLLQKFGLIFPFLFVLVVVWGVLSTTKFLGDKKFIHGIVALVLALLVLFSTTLREVINNMAPWFVLIFIFIVLLLLGLKTFGMTNSEIQADFGWMKVALLIVFIFIFVFYIIDVKVWNEDTKDSADIVAGEDVGSGDKSAFFAVIRHPAVLGMLLVLMIAVFTIKNLSAEG